MKKFAVSVIGLLALLAAVFVATGLLKAPMGADLSVVGNGRPALVLAYENYSPAGGDALNRLKEVRADYEDRLQFVVADLGTPQGRAFAGRFNLTDGVAVFMAGNGEALGALAIPANEDALRRELDRRLAQAATEG